MEHAPDIIKPYKEKVQKSKHESNDEKKPNSFLCNPVRLRLYTAPITLTTLQRMGEVQSNQVGRRVPQA